MLKSKGRKTIGGHGHIILGGHPAWVGFTRIRRVSPEFMHAGLTTPSGSPALKVPNILKASFICGIEPLIIVKLLRNSEIKYPYGRQ